MQDTIKDSALQVVDEDFKKKIANGELDLTNFIFLSQHQELPRQWVASCDDATFKSRFEDILGPRSSVSPFRLSAFIEKANEEGFQVMFFSSAIGTLDWFEHLNDTPSITINSDIENSVNGFLPFQAKGFNHVKQLPASIINWDTGTGKTILAAAVNKWCDLQSEYDFCIWVVKAHNKINTKRAVQHLTKIGATAIIGDKSKRDKLYQSVIDEQQVMGSATVVINYEAFKSDFDSLKKLVENKRVLFIWDEMPNKLKNRSTALYQAVCEMLYKSQAFGKFYPRKGSERTKEVKHVILTATTVENSPEDVYNCVRLIDPEIYGSPTDFYSVHVHHRDHFHNIPPDGWQHLDWMGAKIAHITNQASKEHDPEIAAQFPEQIITPYALELSKAHQSLYNTLYSEYEYMLRAEPSLLNYSEILSAINCFQMLCDNPRMVLESAKLYAAGEKGSEVAAKLRVLVNDDSKFTDVDKKGNLICSKLIALEEILKETPGQILIFNSYANLGIPIVSEWIEKWGFSSLEYTGSMSPSNKQKTEDQFKSDASVKALVLSDAGSDSLNFQNCGRVVHYNQSWTWARKKQKQSRVDRIDTKFKTVEFIDFIIEGSVEERRLELQMIKKDFQDQFDGAITEQSEFLRNANDWLYILLGKRKGED